MLTDTAIELWERFQSLDQAWKPVAILAVLLAVALIRLVLAMLASDMIGPFRNIPAPMGYPPPLPIASSLQRRLEHYVTCLYVAKCMRQRIGWFAPRLLTWLITVGVAGASLLGTLDVIGLQPISKEQFLEAYVALLAFGVVLAFTHNAGRLHGLRAQNISVLTFANVFALPIVLTIAFMAAVLFRPSAMSLWKLMAIIGVVD